MKQHITGEQFFELLFEDSLNLLKILGVEVENSEEQKEGYSFNQEIIKKRFGYYIKRVNLGMMLKLLENTTRADYQIINEGGSYCISFKLHEFIDEMPGQFNGMPGKLLINFESEYHPELCDSLWEATKSLLSQSPKSLWDKYLLSNTKEIESNN